MKHSGHSKGPSWAASGRAGSFDLSVFATDVAKEVCDRLLSSSSLSSDKGSRVSRSVFRCLGIDEAIVLCRPSSPSVSKPLAIFWWCSSRYLKYCRLRDIALPSLSTTPSGAAENLERTCWTSKGSKWDVSVRDVCLKRSWGAGLRMETESRNRQLMSSAMLVSICDSSDGMGRSGSESVSESESGVCICCFSHGVASPVKKSLAATVSLFYASW